MFSLLAQNFWNKCFVTSMLTSSCFYVFHDVLWMLLLTYKQLNVNIDVTKHSFQKIRAYKKKRFLLVIINLCS